MFDHPWGSTWPLYGSIPYLLGHSEAQDASVAWLNSAETWVDLFPYINSQEYGTGTHASFTSQGGAMEFFVFGSTLGPKAVNKALSELSGYAPIPSINSLGFHFCKWEYNSAEMLLERNDNFTAYGFPVDVLWSDIEYSENKQYFVFNQSSWPQLNLNRLNNAINKAGRRMVLIEDCHISYNTSYPVYVNGVAQDAASMPAPNATNIYVK
jgi:alpha 1,3-glucosidase